jgi:hypothetical protein
MSALGRQRTDVLGRFRPKAEARIKSLSPRETQAEISLLEKATAMHYPYLAFCINQSGELVISHQRDPNRKHPLEMELPLIELASKGREDAARSIGELTLALLEKWYPEQFAGFPSLRSGTP